MEGWRTVMPGSLYATCAACQNYCHASQLACREPVIPSCLTQLGFIKEVMCRDSAREGVPVTDLQQATCWKLASYGRLIFPICHLINPQFLDFPKQFAANFYFTVDSYADSHKPVLICLRVLDNWKFIHQSAGFTHVVVSNCMSFITGPVLVYLAPWS